MEAFEAMKLVYARIQAMDPDHADGVMSTLLSQDHGDKEMIRLAFGPESHLSAVVSRIRSDMAATAALRRLPPASQDVYDIDFDGGEDDGGWKQCSYFARGHCKNGPFCRFPHAGDDEDDGVTAAAAAAEHELFLRRYASATNPKNSSGRARRPPSSQLTANAFPFVPSPKCVDFYLQAENRRAALAAMLLDEYRYAGRSPRLERSDLAASERQIYLTFPADSTFSEEDVSSYFSIYGPVEDVRIPYQQKRMFGFVTFLFPETVRLILAKGNPHFICDARVLVKPYKDKAKLPDKSRRGSGEFIGGSSPPPPAYNLDHLEALLMRARLEDEQQQQQQQQKAMMELQRRRFMELKLRELEAMANAEAPSQDPWVNNSGAAAAAAEAQQRSSSSTQEPQQLPVKAAERESASTAVPAHSGDIEARERGLELTSSPERLFASPSKAAADVHRHLLPGRNSTHILPSPTLRTSASLGLPHDYSRFFGTPSFQWDHGAVGM